MNTAEIMKAPSITYKFEAYAGRLIRPAATVFLPDGSSFKRPRKLVAEELKWEDQIENLVTTVGKNDMLDKYFAGATYTATWFVGLIDNASYTAVAVGDTMASHAGWIETHTTYDEATREAVSWSAASAGSKTSSAVTEFTMNATITIRGAFLNSVGTKGGTTGILYSAAAFSGTRALVDNDLLRVTPTYTLT
jgi:hypothetical protein